MKLFDIISAIVETIIISLLCYYVNPFIISTENLFALQLVAVLEFGALIILDRFLVELIKRNEEKRNKEDKIDYRKY